MAIPINKIENKRKHEHVEFETTANDEFMKTKLTFDENRSNISKKNIVDNEFAFADFMFESLADYSMDNDSLCSIDLSIPEGLYEEGVHVDEIGDGRKQNKGSPHRKSYSQMFKISAISLKDSGLGAENISQILGTARSNIEKWCSKKVTKS